MEPDKIRFEVLRTCFCNKTGYLGYYPNESYEQWAARFFCPFKQISPGHWARDFEAMDRAAYRAGFEGYDGWSNHKKEEARALMNKSWQRDEEEDQLLFKQMSHLHAFAVYQPYANENTDRLKNDDFKKEELTLDLVDAEKIDQKAKKVVERARKNAQAQKRKLFEEEKLLNEAILEAEKQKILLQKPKKSPSELRLEELRLRSDTDLNSLVNSPKIIPQINGAENIPPLLSLYSFLHMAMIRQKLMINILFFYERWLRQASLPDYHLLRVLFLASENYPERVFPPFYKNSSTKTKGAFLIVQSIRNIVGIVLDLRRILTAGGEFALEYHTNFQILYSVCNQRQFSMSILEGISLLGKSSELIDLYRAIVNFENFIQGSDLIVFRLCFRLFSLPSMDSLTETLSNEKLADLFLHHGLISSSFSNINLHDVSGRVMFEWNNAKTAEAYYQSLSPTIKVVQSVWKKNMDKCAQWHSSPPSKDDIHSTPEYESFLFSLVGSSRNFTTHYNVKWDNPVEHLESLIQACGLSFGQSGTQESVLSFLLSPSNTGLLSEMCSDMQYPSLIKNLPFTKSIFKVRLSVFASPIIPLSPY